MQRSNFVHVQAHGNTGAPIILAIPVKYAESLQEVGAIFYRDRCNPPFVMNTEFDDMALAIPGSFIVKA